jgi:hypothetical protein
MLFGESIRHAQDDRYFIICERPQGTHQNTPLLLFKDLVYHGIVAPSGIKKPATRLDVQDVFQPDKDCVRWNPAHPVQQSGKVSR